MGARGPGIEAIPREAPAPPPPASGFPVALPPFPGRELVVPMAVLLVLTVAEFVTAAIDARLGLPIHAGLLAALVMLGARSRDSAMRELYWSLTLAPIIRIGSLAMPLSRLPLIAWYPVIGLPIFTATFVVARKLGYRPTQVGLTMDPADTLRQLSIIPVGMLLGLGEYLIFSPAPLAARFTLADIWLPAVILTIFTGLEEELIFRGVMQRAALRALGRWGLIYISLVFMVLHIGYLSLLDLVFVFLVGLLFSLFALRTRSLFGVTLAHGAINIGLFLIFPYLAPIVLGTGYADMLPLPPLR